MQVPHLGQRPAALFSGHFQHRSQNKQLTPGEKEPSDQVLFLYGAPIRAIPKTKSIESSEPPYERMKYPSLPKPISSFISAEVEPAEPGHPISNKKTSPDTTEIRPRDNQEDDWLDFFGARIHPVQQTSDTTTTPARAWIPYPSLHPDQSSTETREPEVASKQKSTHRNPTASRESNAQDLRKDKPWPFYGAQIPAIVTTPEKSEPSPRFQYPSLRQFLDS